MQEEELLAALVSPFQPANTTLLTTTQQVTLWVKMD